MTKVCTLCGARHAADIECGHRRCIKCKAVQVETEFAYRGAKSNPYGKNYRSSKCLTCNRSDSKIYHVQNKSQVAARKAARYSENPQPNRDATNEWRRRNQARDKAYKAQWVQDNLDKVAAKSSAYRARKRNAPKVEKIDHLAVFERDSWICQLCLRPVDPTLKGHDPRAKSLDHIVPLSRGGEHTYANVQLAHFGCNSQKWNRLLDELAGKLAVA